MRLPSKRQTFWLLMIGSAIAFALPTPPLRGPLDPALPPLSAWLYNGTQSLRDQAGQWFRPPGGSDPQLQADRDALLAEVIALRVENSVLTTQRDQAAGIRGELQLQGRLIPATVLARDSVSWREAALIDMGRNVQLQPKQWVIAGVRTFIDRGHDAELAEGSMAIMPMDGPPARRQYRRSVLVGRVELVGQVTARIKLLSDWDSSVSGQVYDPKTDRLGPLCTIRGQGPGQMLLAERVAPPRARAGETDRDEAPAEVEQVVLTVANAPNLPGRLLIGVVKKVSRVSLSPVEYSLEVMPAVDYADVQHVFIVDPSHPRQTEGR